MKSYKDFQKISIGGSDIANLILVGPGKEDLITIPLHFGGDGCYSAYFVEGKATIGEHYYLVEEFKSWLRIYDDFGLTRKFDADVIRVYRAAECGCIIQVL